MNPAFTRRAACWPVAALLLWLVSPVVGWWISRPLAARAPDLSVDQRAFLRTSARRTCARTAASIPAPSGGMSWCLGIRRSPSACRGLAGAP